MKRETNHAIAMLIFHLVAAFSSPDLNAQVSFFITFFSPICLSVHPNLLIFVASSPEPLGHLQSNLAQSIFG